MASVSTLDSPRWPTTISAGRPARPESVASRPLNPYRILRDAVLIVALLLVNKGNDAGAILFFLILAAMVLYSPRTAFQAIVITTIGLMINTYFVPKSLTWTPARLVLFPLALARFTNDAFTRRLKVFTTPTYAAFMLYVLTMAICSIASGWYTQIALLKLLNFWVALSAVFVGTAVLRADRIDLTEWTVSLITACALLGALAIGLGVAEARKWVGQVGPGGFTGAFLHQNCHSLFGSLFVTFLASMAVLGDYRRRWIAVPLIAVWLVFMAWSAARTSFAATASGLFVLVLLAAPHSNRFGQRLRVNLSRPQIVGFTILAAVAALFYDVATDRSITKSVVAFVNKRTDLEAVDVDAALSSRLPLIEISWNTFLENPLFGIGFQLAKNEYFIANATIFTAPTEKGFLPTAVLEEGGVLGASTFVFFVVVLIASLYRQRAVPAMVAFITFLASNFGEVSLFSVGGAGAFGWMLLGLAMILGDHCWLRSPMTRGRR